MFPMYINIDTDAHTYVYVYLSAIDAYSQKSLDLGFQTVGCEQMRNMQGASPPNPGKRRRKKKKKKIVPHKYIGIDMDMRIHICIYAYLSAINAYSQGSLDLGVQTVGCEQMGAHAGRLAAKSGKTTPEEEEER